jgi:hypothetical protein
MNLVPPTLIAETIIVIIPIGAIPSSTLSDTPIEVARNCLVTSSPKRVKRGLKSEKALLPKNSALEVEAVVLVLPIAILV